MNIDRYLQCMRKDKKMPDGSWVPGHNFIPMKAYVDENDILHLNIWCKWCEYVCEGKKPYEEETPEEIYERYGFRLDGWQDTV